MTLRWLQWSTIDLKSGAGGVEVHARCLDRELKKLGVESVIASGTENARELFSRDWDVIHTHGSIPSFKRVGTGSTRPIRVHTLHGTTLGRMHACREYLWARGYLAYAREWAGVMASDVVLGVHPFNHLVALASRLGKVAEVCWNGWDSADGSEAELSQELLMRIEKAKPFFCFVGRGEDPVKNTTFLTRIFQKRSSQTEAEDALGAARLVVIPGDGFALSGKASGKIVGTGRLSHAEIQAVLKRSQGLLLTSVYEGGGLPLVVLEALTAGVPVFMGRLGGLDYLSEDRRWRHLGRSGLQGIRLLPLEIQAWREALAQALAAGGDSRSVEHERLARAQLNQKLLPTWTDVARKALEAVERFKSRLQN